MLKSWLCGGIAIERRGVYVQNKKILCIALAILLIIPVLGACGSGRGRRNDKGVL